MICPDSIASTPLTAPKSFTNWARSLNFTAAKSFRPSTRGEIVEIIRQAEAENRRIKWTGSRWSFTSTFVATDVIIESELISGVIDSDLILNRLPLSASARRLLSNGLLVHIKGGTKIFNVNRLLHGLPAAVTGGRADETNLNCFRGSKAMPTLGGSGGQSIAGLLATGSHGGDVLLPPIADNVVAIHLIGPGGQEWWIERTSGLTSGSETEVQHQLQEIALNVPGASQEICQHVILKKDDNFFNSVLVSVGRMGFVYSLVFRVSDAFKLTETRSDEIWESFRGNLTAANFASFISTTAPHFLQVLINPFATSTGHSCKVARRVVVPCPTPNVGMTAGGPDPMAFVCQQQDARIFLAILIPVLIGLIAVSAGLAALAAVLVAIPFIGWALAAATYAALAALLVVITALSALIAYLTVSGSLTVGELIARIINFMYTVGLKDLMKALLNVLFNSAYPIITKTGVSWKIMDTYGYAGEDFCQKVDSMEFAFDVADTHGGGYLAFIQEVLNIFADLDNRNIAVAGLMALRYTRNTSALIAMSKFSTSCHIEIPILKSFAGNAEFLDRVQRAAIRFNGVPHWGQLMNVYSAIDIRNLNGGNLTTWRRTLRELIRRGSGNDFTFSNDFTMTYNLEPWDDVVITAVILSVTVGDDSLGDTDLLRGDVSKDFAFVRLSGGGFVEVSLNEGSTWNAHTTHERIVHLPTGTTWSDVLSVGIRHVAAGNDWNADNWTMNQIIISTVSDTSEVRQRFIDTRNYVWQFRKNDHQIWEHNF